jgi:hypothetical protein
VAEKSPQQIIQEEIAAFNGLLRDKTIDPNTYHKLMVGAAYEFATIGEFLRAAGVVQTIPIEYFETVQTRQMAEDQEYAQRAYSLAKLLVENNLIDLVPAVKFNHPPAQA